MKFSYFFIPTVLVLILPIVFILCGYTWTTSELTQYPYLKYFTLSGGGIYGILVSVVLTLVLMFYYRKNKTLALAIACYCALAVSGLDLTKHFLKNYFEEPRPFVYQMAKTIYNADDPTYFRNLQLTYTNLNALAGLGLAKPANPETTDSTSSDPNTTTNPTSNSPASNSSDSKANSDSPNTVPANADNNSANNETANPSESTEAPVTEQQALSCKQCRNPEEISNFYYSLNTDQRKFFIKYFNSRFLNEQPVKIQEELKSYAEVKHYSLPSGHAILGSVWIMIFFVLAFNVRLWSFWAITWVVTAWGIGLEASRILLGVHYPHDVLFGAVMASAGVWTTFWVTLVIYGLLYQILNKWLKVFPLHQVPANFVIPKVVKASKEVETNSASNTKDSKTTKSDTAKSDIKESNNTESETTESTSTK